MEMIAEQLPDPARIAFDRASVGAGNAEVLHRHAL